MNRLSWAAPFANVRKRFAKPSRPTSAAAARSLACRVEPLEGRTFLAADLLAADPAFGQGGRARSRA